MGIDSSQYVAGGYLLVKYSDKGFTHSPLLPDRVISLSNCIGEKLRIHWGWMIEQERQKALDFGITEDHLAKFHEWSLNTDADAFGIYTLDAARTAAQTFFASTTDVLLIGVGLHRELVDEFLTFKPYPDVHPNYVVFQKPDADEFAKKQLENHFVNERKPLENGDEPLGFEVISYSWGWGHSWLCVGLEDDMNRLFGIRPNQYGLINTYEEAKRVYDWIADDKMQGERAEPEPHYPWLIVRYPIIK